MIVNVGNRQATGEFWEMETCTGRPYDNQPTSVRPAARRSALIQALIPQGRRSRSIREGPICNPRGLTDLGEHFISRG